MKWKIIPEKPNYLISEKGDVVNSKTNKSIKPFLRSKKSPYLAITLWFDGKGKYFPIHRLLAEAFIPNPEKKLFVNHKNGIKDDNRLENLEWCTHKENIQHAHKNNLVKSCRGVRHLHSKLTEDNVREIRKMYKDGFKQREIGSFYDLNQKSIWSIIHFKTWKHIT